MPGTLVITTLSDGTNSTSATNCIQGSAKVWVNFDGLNSPYSIRGSFNVSSVVRNSTGNYTINFTTAMPNANYCFIPNASYDSQNLAGTETVTLTTTSARFETRYPGNNTTYDMEQCHAVVFSS